MTLIRPFAPQDGLGFPASISGGVGNFWVAELDQSVVGTIGLLEIGSRQAALRKMFFAANRFYEKNGFRQMERSLLPARFPIMSVDTKFYALTVTESAA